MKKLVVFLFGVSLLVLLNVSTEANVADHEIAMSEAIAIATGEVPGLATTAKWQRGYYEIKVGPEGEKFEKVYLDPKDGRIMGLLNKEFDISGSSETNKIKMDFKKGLFKITILMENGVAKEVYVDAINGNIIKIEDVTFS